MVMSVADERHHLGEMENYLYRTGASVSQRKKFIVEILATSPKAKILAKWQSFPNGKPDVASSITFTDGERRFPISSRVLKNNSTNMV